MRVLMTADAVGGVWTYALELSRGLRERGCEIELAVLGPGVDDARRRAARDAGIRIHEGRFDLEWMPEPWDDVDRGGAWLLELERHVEPDVVHLNQLAYGALPWQAPAVVVGHSCVGSWWRAVRGEPPPAAWNEYVRRVAESLRAAELVIAPSQAMLDALEQLYGPLARGVTIHNGRAAGARAAHRAEAEPLVLTAGRLWDEAKNADAVDRAAASIRWPVVAVGSVRGPNGGEIAFRWARPLGHLEPEALDAWLRRAAVFALPARYEPFGYGPLEAAQAGCALVLGNIPSLREIWADAAMYVDPDDSDALAATVDGLCADEALRRAMAERARARAAAYGVAPMVDGYRDAYRSLLEARSASGPAAVDPAGRSQPTRKDACL